MATKASEWLIKPLVVTLIGGVLIVLFEFGINARKSGDGENSFSPPSASESTPDQTRSDQTSPSTPLLPALTKFSYELGLRWGPIYVGMTRDELEQNIGPLQCVTEDYDGYYCACRGAYEGVSLSMEMRSMQTGEDPDICSRTDAEIASFTVLMTPAERSAAHTTIVSNLGARLPQFRYLRGPEPKLGEERSRFRPVYTFGDGTYNLMLDYEADAIHILHYQSE